VSWGTGVYDFDNDGFLDILIFHGGLIHLIPQEHTVFRGLGDGKFADVSRQAGPVLSERTTARGACFGDYDNDGKVDAFLVNLGARGTLLHNVSVNTGHWIELKLVGSKSNRDGIGARVEVLAGGKRWTEERVAGSGYLSQNDGRLHFGLGSAATIDKILIRWPSGREQFLEKVNADRRPKPRPSLHRSRRGSVAAGCFSFPDRQSARARRRAIPRAGKLRLPAGASSLSRWRASLCSLPGRARGPRAQRSNLRGHQEHPGRRSPARLLAFP
jgi:hypothetical protein